MKEQFTQAERTKLTEALKNFNWKNPQERQALAETLINLVYDSIIEEDLSSLMCDVIRYDLHQTMQFQHLSGLKAFVHEPGSYAPRSIVVKKVLNLYEKMTSINPTLNILEIDSGRYGDLGEIKRMAKDEILGERYAAIWNTFTGSIASTDTNYGTINWGVDSNATMTTELNAGLRYCRDIGVSVKCIVGRYSQLDWIADTTDYSEKFKEYRDLEGVLTVYRGVPVVYLQQYLDGYGQPRIDSGNIMIITEGTGKLGLKFDIDKYVMESIDSNTYDWNMHAAEMWGVGVVHPEWNYRIQVTG